MQDAAKKIIYVGKAKKLKSRVRQYLNLSDKRPQIAFLMARVAQIDFIVTTNEKEALLLENSLIKKHKPRYNLFLKDDKTYLGLKLTLGDAFPRLIETRRIKNDGAQYYGPFIDADAVRRVKNFIYQFFLLRTCNDHEFANRARPCLEYQIKRCSAPCVGYVQKADYQKQIHDVVRFLKGKNQDLQNDIEQRMNLAAAEENFEEAARLRDLLKSMQSLLTVQNVTQLSSEFVDVMHLEVAEYEILLAVLMVREHRVIDSKCFTLHSLQEPTDALQSFITQYYAENSFIPKEIITTILPSDANLLEQLLSESAAHKVRIRLANSKEKQNLLAMAKQNLHNHRDKTARQMRESKAVLKALQAKLNLPVLPQRIECYDISNIAGQHAVGSMITFIDGKKSPENYKKFKIRTQNTPNDFAMLFEVLKRRFAHADWPMPDLLVVDGGKGQLKQAQTILQELLLTRLPIAAIAKGTGQGKRAKGIYANKKNDEIHLPDRKNALKLKPTSPELMLLQNVRDEAHRFAITYHRKLRDSAITQSTAKPQKALVKKFY